MRANQVSIAPGPQEFVVVLHQREGDALLAMLEAAINSGVKPGIGLRVADAHAAGVKIELARAGVALSSGKHAIPEGAAKIQEVGDMLRVAVARALLIQRGGEVKMPSEDWTLIERAAILQRRVSDPSAATEFGFDVKTLDADLARLRADLSGEGKEDNDA